MFPMTWCLVVGPRLPCQEPRPLGEAGPAAQREAGGLAFLSASCQEAVPEYKEERVCLIRFTLYKFLLLSDSF